MLPTIPSVQDLLTAFFACTTVVGGTLVAWTKYSKASLGAKTDKIEGQGVQTIFNQFKEQNDSLVAKLEQADKNLHDAWNRTMGDGIRIQQLTSELSSAGQRNSEIVTELKLVRIQQDKTIADLKVRVAYLQKFIWERLPDETRKHLPSEWGDLN